MFAGIFDFAHVIIRRDILASGFVKNVLNQEAIMWFKSQCRANPQKPSESLYMQLTWLSEESVMHRKSSEHDIVFFDCCRCKHGDHRKEGMKWMQFLFMN